MTLFSAPDYPQFIADGEDRYHNKAAVLHLTAPDYATPQVESFEAVLPRPQVSCCAGLQLLPAVMCSWSAAMCIDFSSKRLQFVQGLQADKP